MVKDYIKILLQLSDTTLQIKKITNRFYRTGYMVNFENCEVKDGYFLISLAGYGSTPQDAAKDYIKQINGRTLVFNAYTDYRQEVKVLLGDI